MTFTEFNMVLTDNYADFVQNYYPSITKTAIKKTEFRMYSDYRWALNELMDYTYDYISENGSDPDDDLPVLKFIDAVVQFEYDMDLFSKVNCRKRTIFEHAKNLAEDTEDILNAMI